MTGSVVSRGVGELLRWYRGLFRELYFRGNAVWIKSRRWGLLRRKTTVTLPVKVRHILILCKGNICRSPMAEAYLRSILGSESGITVSSAGLDTTDGKPAHPFAQSVAGMHGLTLERHLTAQLTRAMVEKADIVLVMESAQMSSLLKLCPKVRSKTFILSEFNGSTCADIKDPFSGTMDDFQKCMCIIRDSCNGLANQLRKGGTPCQTSVVIPTSNKILGGPLDK